MQQQIGNIETMATGGNESNPTKTPVKGEVSWADPSRLFTGSEKIQQYNPSLLITRKGYQLIDKMRKDDQVKVSLTFKKHAIFSTGFDIVPPDGTPKDWEPKLFLEKCFDQMKGSLYGCLLQVLTALEYGFCLHGDTIIHLPQGDKPIKDLVGTQPWVYSWHNDKLTLAKASKIWLTRKDAPSYKVMYKWWAGGKEHENAIICTGNHPFLLLSGEYKIAEELKAGDRLQPFSFGERKTPNKWGHGPRRWVQVKRGYGKALWKRDAHWVWEELNGSIPEGHIIHHKDKNPMNDDPNNLECILRTTHSKNHTIDWFKNSSIEKIESRSLKILAYRSRPEIKVMLSKKATENNIRTWQDLEIRANRIASLKKGRRTGEQTKNIGEGVKSAWRKKSCILCDKVNVTWTHLQSKHNMTLNEYNELENSSTSQELLPEEVNHKVVSVEFCGYHDVYDIEVPGTHNFSANNIFVHNSVSEKVYESGDIGFGDQLLLQTIKTRKPHSFELLADEFGNLKTIKQYQLSGGWTLSGGGTELPVGKFIMFVNNMEWGNWYGESDLESTYRPWWIKDNSYKWYAMLLERRGIPPIFALYDPNQFHAGLVDSLKEVMESIQAATTGVIPRATPQGLEFWSPQLAKEASDVFQKAIDMFNRDIARSVLMPGLLGFTPDQAEGSYARSKVHFDVFMMVVEFIRKRIEDEVMYEQVIVPLLDYNYPNLEEYPKFKFKPLTEEVRLDLMDRWITAVEKGVVVTQLDDEEHIRTVLGFPEKTGEEVVPVEKKEKKIELSLSRTPNKYEQRIDFARIENRLQQLEDITRKELIQLLTESRDALVGFVERNWKDMGKMVGDLRLKGWNDVQSVLGEFLRQAYEIGVQEMNAEAGHLEMATVKGPMFTPGDALRFLRNKNFYISAILKDRLVNEAKAIIYNAIKVGELPTETQQKLHQLFEPYVGNEDVLKPDKDGVMRATTPHRIETILRTNAAESFNMGRLTEGRRLGKFIQGMQYSAILDDRTTEICQELDGRIFRMDDPQLNELTPPNHFSCRSLLVAIPVGVEIDSSDFITGEEIGAVRDLMSPGFGGNVTELQDDSDIEGYAKGNRGP